MTETVTRLYDTYDHAVQAMNALKSGGFADDQMSLVARADSAEQIAGGVTNDAGGGAEIGAGVGGVLGAGAGLLTGLGLMAIPGVGPVVAVGWFAATAAGAVTGVIAGAATGGIIGSLVSAGVDEKDAHVYAEAMRRGGSLVTVRAPANRAAEARRILHGLTPIDAVARGAEYRKEG